MFTELSKKNLIISVLSLTIILVLSLAGSGAEKEECCLCYEKPECPARYTSFNPSQDKYSPGEMVELTLSGLTDPNADYLIEEIEIQEVGARRTVVYSEVLNQPVSTGEVEWNWVWNQIGDDGEQIDTGHYFALVETQCCGIYRTDFHIQREVKPFFTPCCRGNWNAKLDTGCSRYKSGEEVTVSYKNCWSCGSPAFKELYITRSGSCCGGSDTVYHRTFEGGMDPGRDWSWRWNQRDADGNLVGPGRYTVTIKTECCGTLKTTFTVYESRDCCDSRLSCSRSSCCSGFWPFFSWCGVRTHSRCTARTSSCCSSRVHSCR